jgi:hypothetical protein
MRKLATDHELALKHGFPSVLSENGGPGGLSHTLRSVPPMLEIAKDVERLAPGALMLNYTNPENRVCLALHRYTSVRSIGLCHGVAETVEFVAEMLDMSRDAVDLRAGGVNHFVWTTSLTDRRTGAGLLPTLRERLGGDPPEKWRLCTMLFDRFGVFPTRRQSRRRYIGWAAEFIGTRSYDFDATPTTQCSPPPTSMLGRRHQVRRLAAREASHESRLGHRLHRDHGRARRRPLVPAVVHHPEPRLHRKHRPRPSSKCRA